MQYALSAADMARGALGAHLQLLQAFLTSPVHLDRGESVRQQSATSWENVRGSLACAPARAPAQRAARAPCSRYVHVHSPTGQPCGVGRVMFLRMCVHACRRRRFLGYAAQQRGVEKVVTSGLFTVSSMNAPGCDAC